MKALNVPKRLAHVVDRAPVDGPREDVAPLAIENLHEALHLRHVVERHAAVRGRLLRPAFVERALDLKDAGEEGVAAIA